VEALAAAGAGALSSRAPRRPPARPSVPLARRASAAAYTTAAPLVGSGCGVGPRAAAGAASPCVSWPTK
jgi:hypothetical protein